MNATVTAIVTDRDGNPAPDVNWGETDLSGINLANYPGVDPTERITVSGFTGPRYVKTADNRLADLSLGKIVFGRKPHTAGYCPLDAEREEQRRFVSEQVTADSYRS